MNSFSSTLLISLFLLTLASCSQKDDIGELNVSASVSQTAPVQTATPTEKKEEVKKYVYPHSQERDPFIPLVGDSKGYYSGGDSQSIVQNLANLELKGIIKDQKGKVAMIGSSTGESYMLRSGRIYDRRNRMVSGISGVIKENSVVLISQNKAVKELPLIKKEGN